MASPTAVPPKCYKPFITRTPALAFFVFLNLILVLLVEMAFHTLPTGVGDDLVSRTFNLTTDSDASISSSAHTFSTLSLDKRMASPIIKVYPTDNVNACNMGNPPPRCYHANALKYARDVTEPPSNPNGKGRPKNVRAHPGCDRYGNRCTHNHQTDALGSHIDVAEPLGERHNPPGVSSDPFGRKDCKSYGDHCLTALLPPPHIQRRDISETPKDVIPTPHITMDPGRRNLPNIKNKAPDQRKDCKSYGNRCVGHESVNLERRAPSAVMSTIHIQPIHAISSTTSRSWGWQHWDPCKSGDPPSYCYHRRAVVDNPLPTSFTYPDHTSVLLFATTTATPASLVAEPAQAERPLASNPVADSELLHRRQSNDTAETERHQTWTIPNGVYFVGNYLPVVIAVLLSILWSIMAASIKAMEPFYQLADQRVASGARSLNLKCTTSGIGLVAFRAIAQGHWAVVWSSAISFILTLLVPLSSEMILIDTKVSCVDVSPELTHCDGKLRVSPIIGRIVQGLLGLAAVVAATIVVLMWNRWSGVFADPSSIAGLATLFQNEDVLEEFRRLDPQISDDELAKALARKRYQLGYYRNSGGCEGYGLMTCKEDKWQNHKEYKEWDETSISNSTNGWGVQHSRKVRARRSLWLHPASTVAFALCLVGLLTIIIFYHLTGQDSGFERFMDSEGFGVSFMMTAIGVLIKSYWVKAEEETRILEPYRKLSLQNAHPKDTILVRAKSNPITALVAATASMNPHLILLALNTVLAEALTVALSRIPFQGDSIWIAYLVSSRLCTAIIPLMLATLFWVAWRARQTMDIPRRPDTIAAVLTYLCGSRMLRDFEGLATMDGERRDEVVWRMGKRYRFGTVLGADGVERVGIENDIPLVQG